MVTSLDKIVERQKIIKKAIISFSNNYQMASTDDERRRTDWECKKFIESTEPSKNMQYVFKEVYRSMKGGIEYEC